MVWEPTFGCGCCASPRTAALIIGYLGLVVSLMDILGIAGFASRKDEFQEWCHPSSSEDRTAIQIDRDFGSYACNNISSSGLFSAVAEAILQGVINLLLILGVNKRNQCLMLPWMIMQCIAIISCILVGVIVVIVLMVVKFYGLAFLALFIIGFITFLCTYFFLVVRVVYKEVKAQQVTMSNDLEVGYITTQQLPTPQEFKNLADHPPSYTRLDDREGAPPPYTRLENQEPAPPPYKV